MLISGDAALGGMFQFRPEFGGQHGPREPAHADGQIVEIFQNGVDEDIAHAQHFHEILTGRLNQTFVANPVEGVVFQFPLAQLLRLRLAARAVFVHHEPPGPGDERLIVGGEVGFGEGQAESRAVGGFVLGLDHFLCGVPIRGAETFSLPRLGVETVEHGAAFAEPVFFLHGCLSG